MFLLSILLLGKGIDLPAAELMVCYDCPYTTIKAAVAAAEKKDTLFIVGGPYCETNIEINKPLTLIGVDYPLIDADGGDGIFLVTAPGVTIQGMHLARVGTSYIKDRAAIRIRKTYRFRILDNYLEDTFFAIYLEHARRGVVEGNRVFGQAREEASSGNAIHLWYCKEIQVLDNHLSGHRDGIYFEFVDDSHISGNLSENNLRYGLHFMFSNDDDYVGNTFRGNGAGVAVMFSRRIEMHKNRFLNNWGSSSYGLLLKEIFDGSITNNLFQENTIGIYVEGSNRITYEQNNLVRNGWAIKIAGGCADNLITRNNFLSNTFEFSISGRGSSNKLEGNYWSDYSGYDLDRDGVGDVPHRPVKLFAYVVDRTPEAMVLLRSLFVDLVNLSEKVSPVLTPANVSDPKPANQPLPPPNLTISENS